MDGTLAKPTPKRFAGLSDPPEWLLPGLLALVAVEVFLVRSGPSQVPLGLTFNSMMQHMLHGRFDVDPATIADEAYIHDGRSYAYFGVFCALLRLPLLAAGLPGLNITVVSIGVATLLGAWARLRAAALAMNDGRALTRVQRMIVLTAFALSGETIQFLAPSIYQEVCSWAAALASVFGLLALRLCLGKAKSRSRLYLALAAVAGLELLCRVTFGIGAYLAMAAIFTIDLWRAHGRNASCLRSLVPAGLVLVLAVAAAGGVNYARWGKPTTFMPLDQAVTMNRLFPDRLIRMKRYGEFNIERVPFALEYYLAPAFAFNSKDGPPHLSAKQQALYDDVELPAGSLLLGDALVVALAANALGALGKRHTRLNDPLLGRSVIIALAVPLILTLSFVSLTFRYRLEFYPALDLAAFLGLRSLASRERPLPAIATPAFAGLAALALSSSLIFGVLYRNTSLGPLQDFTFRGGWMGATLNSHGAPMATRPHVLPVQSTADLEGRQANRRSVK